MTAAKLLYTSGEHPIIRPLPLGEGLPILPLPLPLGEGLLILPLPLPLGEVNRPVFFGDH